MERMNWDRLISDKRLGLEHYHDSKGGGVRSDFERDYDRLVFSSPFRRLQNKTQVFPLPDSIFVHNRLTHSLEVSSVGKSMAREVVIRLMPRYKGEPWADKLRDIGEIAMLVWRIATYEPPAIIRHVKDESAQALQTVNPRLTPVRPRAWSPG